MAAKAKFNANRPKPKLIGAAVKKIRRGKGGGKKRFGGNAWRAYLSGGVSNAPIPW
jgi:hypothetical protein